MGEFTTDQDTYEVEEQTAGVDRWLVVRDSANVADEESGYRAAFRVESDTIIETVDFTEHDEPEWGTAGEAVPSRASDPALFKHVEELLTHQTA